MTTRAWLAVMALALIAPTVAWAQWSGELRARRDTSTENNNSASVQGSRLSTQVPPPAPNTNSAEANLRGRWQVINADAELKATRKDGGKRERSLTFKELYALVPAGNAQFSAGRRFVEWDVGFGFRPNDLVQQDTVRAQRQGLLSTKPVGRYVVQGEVFWADSSLSFALVNPQRFSVPLKNQRGANETALVGMAFLRQGSFDLYGFGRLGKRTGPSLGAAFAGVVEDSFSVYGSARVLRRHDAWVYDPASSDTLLSASPWRQATLGYATQALLGASWTGALRQSILLEWWHDGTTLSDDQWELWQNRTDQLSALGLAALQGNAAGIPPTAIGANLAWQDLPLSGLNQRRQTVLLRLSWQPDPWLFFVDTVFNPSDYGRSHTAGLQWQGDSIRLDAVLRWFGGPDDSLTAQLPIHRMGLVALTWSY